MSCFFFQFNQSYLAIRNKLINTLQSQNSHVKIILQNSKAQSVFIWPTPPRKTQIGHITTQWYMYNTIHKMTVISMIKYRNLTKKMSTTCFDRQPTNLVAPITFRTWRTLQAEETIVSHTDYYFSVHLFKVTNKRVIVHINVAYTALNLTAPTLV